MSFNQVRLGGNRLFQGKMSGDGFNRLPIDEDLDSLDLRKIEGKRIDDGINRHHLS